MTVFDFGIDTYHGEFLRNNSHRVCVPIFVINDRALEDTENFFLDLSLDETQQDLVLHNISPNVTSVSIIDDDGPVIGFGNHTYNFNENINQVTQASVEFGVLSGALQVAIPIWFNSSIANPSDFQEDIKNEIYVLDSSCTMVIIPFTIANDAAYEATESIQLYLAFASQPPDRVRIDPDMAVVNIMDLNELIFGFQETEYSVDEKQSSVNLTVELISGVLEEYFIILQATTQDETAIAGVDYMYTSVRLQFDNSEQELPVEIPLLESDATGSRAFFVALSVAAVINSSGNELNVTAQELNRIRLDISANPVKVTILSNMRSTMPSVATMNSSSNSAIILAATLSVLFAVLAIFICCFIVFLCWLRAKKKREKELNIWSELRVREAKESSYQSYNNMEMNKVQSSFKLKISKHLIINSRNLKMEGTVGQGQYGIVYKGYLTKGFSQNVNEVVAVKTLKGFFDKNLVRGLLEECSKMADFNHPNVLTLTGVCLDGGPTPYIVMPFMFNGSLQSYLSKNKETLLFPTDDSVASEEVNQAMLKLTDICLQIAKGMEYLASKRVIHRDLATRNCMVDMNFVIKVSDFGLSETINPSKEYVRQKEDGVKLPFKWMSPESLEEGIFSEKTDVWSYGVTCWEVFSVGKSPYPGTNPIDLAPLLQSGYRMDKPLNAACSDAIHDVVVQCWKSKADERPHFSDLVPVISRIMESSAGYLGFYDTAVTTASADYHKTELSENQSSIKYDD